MNDVPPGPPGRVYALDQYRRAVTPNPSNISVPQAHLMLHRLAHSLTTLRPDMIRDSRFSCGPDATLDDFTLDYHVTRAQILRARLHAKASPHNCRIEACVWEIGPDNAQTGGINYHRVSDLMLIGADHFATDMRTMVFEWAQLAASNCRVMRGQVQIMKDRDEAFQAVYQRLDFPGCK